MKEIHKQIPLSDNPYIVQYFSEKCAFFDIETTGFSPKNSFVYLIGLVLRDSDTIHIYQFLAENRSEEPTVLTAFHQKIESVDTLITFNGLGFDIPFLKSRELMHHICINWDSYENIDLYTITGKLSRFLHLQNKKQKTVEQFLDIYREDTYTGGELISIYYEYEKLQDSYAETLLLLHNYDDVLGMTNLLSLLSYRDLFELPVHVLKTDIQICHPYQSDTDKQEFLLELKVSIPFPKTVFYKNDFCSCMCQDTSARLLVNIFSGELKFFYDNYKDYYYLPEEDMAIHKSIASFVDSSHRKKATAGTCYTKKTGLFLPQNAPVLSPSFSSDKKCKICYFELTEDFLSDETSLNLYASHLLKLCQ